MGSALDIGQMLQKKQRASLMKKLELTTKKIWELAVDGEDIE